MKPTQKHSAKKTSGKPAPAGQHNPKNTKQNTGARKAESTKKPVFSDKRLSDKKPSDNNFSIKNTPTKKESSKSYAHFPKQKWLYGTHAVVAALQNQKRTGAILLHTVNQTELVESFAKDTVKTEISDGKDLSALLPDGAVHQGLALWVHPLPSPDLQTAIKQDGAVLVLDQITDPHNVGAILRSCAAFGVQHIIMQDRHSAEITGALAKSACGALEKVNIHLVTNISQTLQQFKKADFWCVALAGEGTSELHTIKYRKKMLFVLGAEGAGVRPLIQNTCDDVVRIPIHSAMESLNVSNAAAVTLYSYYLNAGNNNKD